MKRKPDPPLTDEQIDALAIAEADDDAAWEKPIHVCRKKPARSSLSRSRSYVEMGEFWDEHDLGDFWDQTEEVEFEVDIQQVEGS
ncbi:MAG: hypothetical protein HY260_11070 [Chloroflexi bacterium]|nr:hypothetical protein [Chloroflexota bacterium]